MNGFLIAGAVMVGLLILSEPLMAAANYRWWWHDYRCRLETVTSELKRYVRKWWWVILIKAGILVYAVIALILFPPTALPLWSKITALAVFVTGLTLYGWLLLHLGGYAKKIFGGSYVE